VLGFESRLTVKVLPAAVSMVLLSQDKSYDGNGIGVAVLAPRKMEHEPRMGIRRTTIAMSVRLLFIGNSP
jgi:hypothetical protein